jgi:hypothetical protein
MRFRGFVMAVAVACGSAAVPAAAQVPPAQVQPPSAPEPRVPRVVCGTTILPADDSKDPLFAKQPPRGLFTMRTHRSAACQEQPRNASRSTSQNLPQFFGPKR